MRLRTFSYSIYSLTKRDIRVRYAGSFFGLLWVIINPLIQLLIYSFVFAIVLRVRLGPQYVGVNYTSWLLAGLLPWMFFADAVGRAPTAVLDNQQLVKKTTFPSSYFQIVQILSSTFQHIIAMIIYLVYLEVVHPFKIYMLPLMFIPFILEVLIIAGIGWAVSSINVYVRDVQQVVIVILNVMFYLTPIIYPENAVPVVFQRILQFNPLYFIVESYRQILLGGTMSFTGAWQCIVFAFLAFVSGYYLFRRLKRGFVDVL